MARVPKPDNALGQNLRRLRRARGLSQRAAAELIGVSCPYLCQLEKGRAKAPTITVGIGISRVYGVSIQQLSDWVEQQPEAEMLCPACGQVVEDHPHD